MNEINQQRRKWLALGGIILGSCCLPNTVLAALSTPAPRILRFRNINTGDTFSGSFAEGKGFSAANLHKLNYLLRDRRTEQVRRMDPNLFTKLYRVQALLGVRNTEIQIISGYRSPATNAVLRRRSRQVATNSYHMRGQAIDFKIDAVPLSRVRRAAEKLNNGGVGYYPYSNFIHIDTGPARTWRGS